MNERIQKLYDQADKFAKENRTQTISGPGNNYFELFHEKFAELIVRECVAKCEVVANMATITNNGEMARKTKATADSCAIMIKQHFGVEE